jgi:hypothetical protein
MGGWIGIFRLCPWEGANGTRCQVHPGRGYPVDYLARTRAFSSWSKQLINLNQTLEERQILLCLQEMDLEVQ